MIRSLAGAMATLALRWLATLPPDTILTLGQPFLPVYTLLRYGLSHRLTTLQGLPFDPPTPAAYYRMRLRLASLALRHLSGRPDGCALRIEGKEYYREALESGKPVALLGWHQGTVELLHRIPPPPPDGRPFLILTAQAFAPALTAFLDLGRRQPGKTVVAPGNFSLREWVRSRGVMAAMIDQIPGKAGGALSLWNGRLTLPAPLRLLEFLEAHQAVCLPVSALMECGEIRFRYHMPLENPLVPALGGEIEGALERAPSQYNWSYPKIRA